ncbi:MAG: Ig-like domain-containing protein [Bacteroidaceae bacterium]|nr:Ig-like domain-containing protein [Bacteroidaceae bacterium]
MKIRHFVAVAAVLVLAGCRINELDSRIDIIESRTIADLSQQQTSMLVTMGYLKEAEEDLKALIGSLQGSLDELRKSIGSTDGKVETVRTELLDAITSVKNGAESGNRGVRTAVDTLISRYAEIVVRLDGMRAQMEGKTSRMDTDISGLESRVDHIDSVLVSMQAMIDNLASGAGGTSTAEIEKWISTTYTTLEQYNGVVNELAGITQSVNSIRETVSQLETRINENTVHELDSVVLLVDTNIREEIRTVTETYTQAIETAKSTIESANAEAISESVAACENSLKQWVNEQLTGYCTIAQADAKASALKTEIETDLKTEISTLEKLVEDLSSAISHGTDPGTDPGTEPGTVIADSVITAIKDSISSLEQKIQSGNELIAGLKTDLGTLETKLTEEYQTAIAKAIGDLEGKLDDSMESSLSELNKSVTDQIDGRLSIIETNMTTIQGSVNDILGRLSAFEDQLSSMEEQLTGLLSMVQSVTVVPDYSDGSVKLDQSTASATPVRFEIYPLDVAQKLARAGKSAFSMAAVYTETRSGSGLIDLPVKSVSYTDGIVEVTADASGLNSEIFAAGSKVSVNARLLITSDRTSVTSGYFLFAPTSSSSPSPNPDAHVHPFALLNMRLNYDYLLGDVGRMDKPATPEPAKNYVPTTDNFTKYAGVLAKGPYSSSLLEHFEMYRLLLDDDCVESTLSFFIKNYDVNEFVFTDPNITPQFMIEEIKVRVNNVDKYYSKITLTHDQLVKIKNGNILSPELRFVGEDDILWSSHYVLMELEETCNDPHVDISNASKKAYYYVEYRGFPIHVSFDDIVLRSYKDEPDYVMIDTLAKVTVDGEFHGKELFTYDMETGTLTPTMYAKEVFGLYESVKISLKAADTPFSFPYPDDSRDSFGGHLLVADENGAYANVVRWDTYGVDLLRDKRCRLNVEVKIGNCILNPEQVDAAEVLILSTAHTYAADEEDIPAGSKVTSIILNKPSLTMAEGKSATLTATVLPSTAADKTITWTSSDPSVATVTASGNTATLKAVSKGTTTIRAIAVDGSGITGECNVKVSDEVLVESIGIFENGVELRRKEMYVGDTYVLPEPQIFPENATNTELKYRTSLSGNNITIDSNRTITAHRSGIGSISIETTDGSDRYCMINVIVMERPVENISLDIESITIKTGNTFTLTPSVYPANASDKRVKWKSSNTSVATVSSRGVVTARGAGKATITVTTEDGSKEASCEVTVENE